MLLRSRAHDSSAKKLNLLAGNAGALARTERAARNVFACRDKDFAPTARVRTRASALRIIVTASGKDEVFASQVEDLALICPRGQRPSRLFERLPDRSAAIESSSEIVSNPAR